MAAGSRQREDWQECPPGTLQGYARRHKRSRQNQAFARAAGAAVVVFAFTGLTWWSVDRWAGDREYHFGGIACSDVQVNIEAYAMGDLPEATAERIRMHLMECPVCQEMMHRMQPPGTPSAAQQPAGSTGFNVELMRPFVASSRSDGGAVRPELASATAYSIAQAP